MAKAPRLQPRRAGQSGAPKMQSHHTLTLEKGATMTTFDLHPELKPSSDFVCTYHGSIVTFIPLTEQAKDWWQDNVQNGPTLGNAYAVEPRFADAVLLAARSDGLAI